MFLTLWIKNKLLMKNLGYELLLSNLVLHLQTLDIYILHFIYLLQFS